MDSGNYNLSSYQAADQAFTKRIDILTLTFLLEGEDYSTYPVYDYISKRKGWFWFVQNMEIFVKDNRIYPVTNQFLLPTGFFRTRPKECKKDKSLDFFYLDNQKFQIEIINDNTYYEKYPYKY